MGGPGSNAAGLNLIFRGGDTWHFGNPGASPYTGGAWYWIWTGTSANCVYEGTQTGCIYIGVDKSWYSGGSWSRPIFTADNPISSRLVASCTYQIPTNNYSNTFFGLTGFVGGVIFDNFEMTGLCQNGNNGASNAYALDSGSDGPGAYNNFWTNLYIHGWSATTSTTQYSMAAFNMGNTLDSFIGNVVDGSDSYAPAIGAFTFPNILHMKDNIFRYVSQGVGSYCHDIHDNIFEHFYHPLDAGAHNNILECNTDANGPTPNVFYNNIIRHNDPSQNGGVDVWFCPNSTPEYWFNNILYDVGANVANVWDIAGPPNYSSWGCTNTGGQFMFNNTFVNANHPCGYPPANSTNGQYLTVYNEHIIGGSWTTGNCTGGPKSANNLQMSDSTATSRGYTSGSGGTSGAPNQCANDTTPCAPTASGSGTVGVGTSLQSYCTTLAGYTSDIAIGTDAANACKYATTDACTYNATTHTMNCPAHTPNARPSSGNWDSGAHQYNASAASGSVPSAPTGLTAIVQ
jgi:hypothetical protein